MRTNEMVDRCNIIMHAFLSKIGLNYIPIAIHIIIANS